VLSWGSIAVSAVLTAVATFFGMVPFERPVRLRRVLVAAVAAAVGPLLWYTLTRGSTPSELTRELAQPAFPVSRSHLGVAVFTLAATMLALALGPDRKVAARRMIAVPIGSAVAAFGIAVYLT
jgi:uncharacterized membrane protein YozB (DUF420 family)